MNRLPSRGLALLYSILIAYAGIACSPKYIINHEKPSRQVQTPVDDAAHFDAHMEWWYYTGHLTAEDGDEYGFEVTFFKRLLNEDRVFGCLNFMPAYWFKDIGMVGHFAVTDLNQKRFTADQIMNILHTFKAVPGEYHVAINGWSARDVDGTHVVKADMRGYRAELRLTPVKPAALHGTGGIVRKGQEHANYYYSYTRMKAEGVITVKGKRKKVTGEAWMDHEYGTMGLEKSQKGWDWYSLQLDDNTELMLYMIKNNNNLVSESGGTWVDAQGKTRWLSLSDIEVVPTATWYSEKSKTTYPSAWTIKIKPLDVTLHVLPRLAEQELDVWPVTYWEGAVNVEGKSGGKKVTGRGYIELVGYSKDKSFSNVDMKFGKKDKQESR